MGKANQKVILALTVVIVAVTLLLYQNQEKSGGEKFTPVKLFKDLDISKIGQLEIKTKDEPISITKTGDDAWGLASRGGYPVDAEKFRKLVFAIKGLEAADRMTEATDKYDRLGVGEKPESGQVRLLDSAGKELAGLIVGKEREGKPSQEGGFAGPSGQYVRVAGNPAVYKIKESIQVESQPTQWLQREIVKVEENNLQEIRVKNEGTTQSFALARIGTNPFKVLNPIPSGQREKTVAVGGVGRALSNLMLNDVVGAEDAKAKEIKFGSTYEAIQKNGLVYVAETGAHNEDRYVKLSARYDPAMDLAKSDERTSDTVTAKSLELADVAMKKVNDRTAKWIYQIPSYAYENLNKKFSDMIEPIPTPTPVPAPGATAPEGLPSGSGLESLSLEQRKALFEAMPKEGKPPKHP